MTWLLLSGFVLDVCGIIAAITGKEQRAWGLLLAGNALGAVAQFDRHSWLLCAANAVCAVVCAWKLWRGRRRRKRAPRAYGAKSRALIARLVRKAREAARRRPVLRPVPQGLNWEVP
jgi:hypothetical protein